MATPDQVEHFTDTMTRFIDLGAKRLPDDVLARLRELQAGETSPLQQEIYDAYFRNLDKAAELNRPCCQDTGLPHFYITAGSEFRHMGMVQQALTEAVRRATVRTPLRPNAVNFFEERNTGDNTGERMPWIHWDIAPDRDDMAITVFFAGAGCCLPGCSRVFPPGAGYAAIVRWVFDAVSGLGLNACPPLVVGIGLGHNAENAAMLSKKAYLRPLGTSHKHPRGAKLEQDILRGLNDLGIGAQGLRGNRLALAVHIESSARHTATLAVGVNVSCYMHRRGIIRFDNDLRYEVLTHKGAAV